MESVGREHGKPWVESRSPVRGRTSGELRWPTARAGVEEGGSVPSFSPGPDRAGGPFTCRRLHAVITVAACYRRRVHPDFMEYCAPCPEGLEAERVLGIAPRPREPRVALPEVGTAYGSWVFLGKGEVRHRHQYWRMMCRGCGGEAEVRASYARNGISTRCRSCSGRLAALRRWRQWVP